MSRRLLTIVLAACAFAAPAHADDATPQTLMPGVTFTKTVEFTPHGAVVVDVITAPRPGSQGGLYALAPVLAHGTIGGGLERVTQIEKDVSATATVAGINGDLYVAKASEPAGLVIAGGVLQHPPLPGRSSAGIDSTGQLDVARVKFFGTWQGTGQRRALSGIDEPPVPGAAVLFTPAWGAPLPRVAGSSEAVLEPFPAAVPNTDLRATVTATGAGGGESIPADGAILMATGATAKALQAEAPVGTQVASRLILQPAFDGVGSAFGGGPVLVTAGKAIFQPNEDFTNDQIEARTARGGVGQLADGRIVLVAVDGDQPGYSVGLTTFELAQTMKQLGAVTATAVDSGAAVSAAFDGQLLDRPSAAGGGLVKEALLEEYFGVYAAQPPLPLVNGDPTRTVEPLSYKLVRPSTVTAQLVGPNGVVHVLVNAVAQQPGSYPVTFTAFDAEGTWHWNVKATDDLGRVSTVDRTFRYDTTLKGLTAPHAARGHATVSFTLARPASVTLQIETPTGVVVRSLAPVSLTAGAQQVTWDGTLPHGTKAFGGTYVAHVFATSSVGTSDLSVQFTFQRTK